MASNIFSWLRSNISTRSEIISLVNPFFLACFSNMLTVLIQSLIFIGEMIILPRGSFTSTRILCSDAKMANFLIIPLALMESVKSKWTMHSEFAHDNIRANLVVLAR